MKRVLSLTVLLALGFVFLQSHIQSTAEMEAVKPKFKYTKKVNDVIQNKCYGCHSEKGRSDKAKKAIMWDDVPDLSAEEQAEKLKMISGVLEEGSMPPSRFLENNPDKKLTEKEMKTMQKWATKMTKKVMK